MIDSHTHGYRSFDTKTDYNDMISSAVSKGLSGICFTDHYEYYPYDGKFYGFDITDYISDIRNLSQNYSAQGFKVLTGVEFGLWDDNMADKIVYAMDNHKFDSIIGSIHYIPDDTSGYSDIYYSEYTEKYDKFTAYSKILEQYIKILPQYPKINIIGHFDYVARYSQTYEDRNMYYKDFPAHFDKLLTILIDKGISLEINTANYIKRDDYPANKLDINILKRYKELGGEMITIGSDAHKPENIAQNFREVSEIIKDAGFRYLTHFENGKPVFDEICI